MVTEPLHDRAVGGILEPLRRQSHDEDRGGTNNPTNDDHSVGGELLRERADDRRKHNDEGIIDV